MENKMTGRRLDPITSFETESGTNQLHKPVMNHRLHCSAEAKTCEKSGETVSADMSGTVRKQLRNAPLSLVAE
jgi:hypothetical protein